MQRAQPNVASSVAWVNLFFRGHLFLFNTNLNLLFFLSIANQNLSFASLITISINSIICSKVTSEMNLYMMYGSMCDNTIENIIEK